MKKLLKYGWRVIAAIGSMIVWVLTIPMIRNFIWKKVKKIGKEKIIDAEAKVVNKMRK